jgi:type I restriction enzyme S subunit
VRSLRLNHLERFPLFFPKSLPEQSAIASILSSLDAKIELNNKMNKTLEAIGQAIFKKWFIDNPEKKSGRRKVGDLGEFKNGINYLRDEEGDTEFSIINVRNISNNKYLLKNSLDKIKINSKKAKDYSLHTKDIIIARSACPGKISLLIEDIDNAIYSGFSIRYRLNDLKNYYFISLTLEKLQEEINNFSVGTTLSSY